MPTLTKSTTLFSLAAVKDWLRVSVGENTEDSRLVIAADAASEEIEDETSWIFVRRTVSLVVGGQGKTAMAFPQARPIASIDSFTIDGAPIDASTYVVDTDTGIVRLTSGLFTSGVGNIVFTTTSGFDVQDGPGLPRSVYRAGLDLAKAIYDELATGAIAASSVSLGASTMVIKPSKRPPSVQRVIDRWADSYVSA